MCVSSVIKLVAQLTLGSATSDGKPVIGHQTFTEFWNGQYMNLILDITPTTGNRIVFQVQRRFTPAIYCLLLM